MSPEIATWRRCHPPWCWLDLTNVDGTYPASTGHRSAGVDDAVSRLGSELESELPSCDSHGDILPPDSRVGLLGVHFHWGTSEIAARLGQAGFALPGTLLERMMRCGKPNYACRADPPKLHGPYHQWTRKIDDKTTTINLTGEQLARYGTWFVEAQRLRGLLNELEELSLRLAANSEVWSTRKFR